METAKTQKDSMILYGFFCGAYFVCLLIIMGINMIVHGINLNLFITFGNFFCIVALSALLGMKSIHESEFKSRLLVFITIPVVLANLMLYTHVYFGIYKFIIMLLFYFIIGYYPSRKWVGAGFGNAVLISVSIFLGSIAVHVVSLSAFIISAPKIGSFLTIGLLIPLVYWGFIEFKKDYPDNIKFTFMDYQIFGVMLLMIVIHASVTKNWYPHGHPDIHLDFIKRCLRDNVFPVKSPVPMHFGSFSNSIMWNIILNLDVSASIYFQFIFELIGFASVCYFFTKYFMVNKHSHALFALIFAAFCGELHLYAHLIARSMLAINKINIIECLRAVNPCSVFSMRSLITPIVFPESLNSYLDGLVSLSVFMFIFYLVSKYIVCNNSKTSSCVIYSPKTSFIAGIVMIIILGTTLENVLISEFFSLCFLFLFSFMYFSTGKMDKFINKINFYCLLGGILCGIIIYIRISSNYGAGLIMKSGISIKPISEWGIFLYPDIRYFIVSSLSLNSLKYFIAEFGLVIFFLFFVFIPSDTLIPDMRKERKSVLMGAIFPCLIPITMHFSWLMDWNLNRFYNVLITLLHMLCGVGFVNLYLMKDSYNKKSNRFPTFLLYTLIFILIVAIFPVFHFAYLRSIIY
ncbi:MAG: hypothetical protein HQK94_17755 [Nitrospirae bacterium]|nr:hypothetical protein [Nitrospirota bacterium]